MLYLCIGTEHREKLLRQPVSRSANSKEWFNMTNKEQNINNKSGSKQPPRPGAVSSDDLYFTSEMIERIKESQIEIKEGKHIVVRTKEDLDKFFEEL